MNYFKPDELVDSETYRRFGDSSIRFIDERLIISLNSIRAFFNAPIIVNNKKFQWRGLRTPSSPVYSTYSQHSFGRAADFNMIGYDPEEIRNHIIKNPGYIRGIEMDVNWVHIDIRNTPKLVKFYKRS